MKVYVAPAPKMSRAMYRVAAALTAHLPAGHYVVETADEADLEVIHVIGYSETVSRVNKAKQANRRYALIQYCLQTTQAPRPAAWTGIWADASVVWSYYDLAGAWKAEGGEWLPFRPYFAPLGVDEVFRSDPKAGKAILLLTTGYVADSECLRECADAVRRCGGSMRHVGPDLSLGDGVTVQQGVEDETLRYLYQQSCFVAGLRRVEGFELPVYEGLACGARPIVFDKPHYRHWLGEHALYLPETWHITDALQRALETYRPVTTDETRWAKEFFHWKPIITGFWERAL